MRSPAMFTALALMLASGAAVRLPAADLGGQWNQFRGPRGDGVAEQAEPPTTWSATAHVRWKTPLPRPANGSPIVVGQRVLLTSALDDGGTQRSLLCFDRGTGEELWRQTVRYEQDSPTHETNPYGGSTPASDGQRVVVWHASAGLHCYDLEGQPLWSRDLGIYEHMWGYGTSPILHQDLVILQCSPGSRTMLTAIELATGKTRWEVEEPIDGNGQENSAGKYMGSWATPIVVQVGGRPQIICSWPTRVVGYEPASGQILWWCEGLRGERGDLAYSSPLSDGKICIAHGGFQGPALGLNLEEAAGDVTASHRLWRIPEYSQSIGSGILLGDVYYMANAGPGIIECLEARTGKSLWKERGTDGNHWGSIVLAAGRMYVTNQDGTTLVFAPNRERLETIAENRLGEPSNATPAFAGQEVFLRTAKHLFCIGP